MGVIAAYLGKSVEAIRSLFRSSPGMVLLNTATSRQFRIRTIVPLYDRRAKRCVFLSDEGRCTIHPVAPFGCAYFDTHMRDAEWQRRARWGIGEIQGRREEYDGERGELKFTDHWKPGAGGSAI